MSDVTLKPCPYCGSGAGDVKLSRGHGYIIGCGMCQGQQFALTREEAVRLWNQRATPNGDLISREEAVGILKIATLGCAQTTADRIVGAIAALPAVRPTSNVAVEEADSLLPCGHPSHMRANSGYHYCKQYPDGITVSEAVSDSDAGPCSDGS